MDPISLALTGGMDLASIISSIIGGNAQAQQENANRDAQLKIAADTLGLNYAKLKADSDQFQQSQAAQIKQWAATNGFNLQQLNDQMQTAKVNQGMQQQTINNQVTQSNIAQGPAQQQSQRLSDLRKAFLVPGTPVPASLTTPKPAAPAVQAPNATPATPGTTPAPSPVPNPNMPAPVAPTPLNKNLGAQMLNPTPSTGA